MASSDRGGAGDAAGTATGADAAIPPNKPVPSAKAAPAGARATPFAQALEQFERGRLQAAGELLTPALRAEPGNAQLWHLAGNLAKATGQTETAERCWRQALKLNPGFAEAHYDLGVLLQESQRIAEAGAAYRAALLRPAWHPRALNNLGTVLVKEGKPDEALRCFEQAIGLNPAYGKAHHNRGRTLITLGRFDAAQGAFETALGHLPPAEQAHVYRNLSTVKRFRPGDPVIEAMEALAAQTDALTGGDLMELGFALGKAYGDLGEHDRSFQHYLAGNREKRRQTAYDEAATLEKLDRIQAAYSASTMRSRAGRGWVAEAPVFIVGMPRSGSTLVEQILSSHPDVHGAGECEDFRQLAEPIHLGHGIAGLADDGPRELGRQYASGMRAKMPPSLRFVDKNLGNFVNVGLIHLALPSAKIIHTRRDPVETCLSCFVHMFQGDHPYAYDLAELGRYWRAHDRLMEHWHRVLPAGVILDVGYEEVVDDLPGQTRRLLDHLGLEWNAACLDFHRNERPIYTASARQVREPIYRSSMRKSAAYGDLLRPLLDALAQ